MTRAALVIGGGIAGIQAATDLAAQGFPVTLVEKQDRLGGRLAAPNLKYLYPNMRPAAEVLEEKLERLREERRPGAARHRGREHHAASSAASRPTLKGQVDGDPAGGRDHPGHRGRPPRSQGRVRLRRAAQRASPASELEQAFCESEDELPDRRRSSRRAPSFILCVGSRETEGFTGCSRYCCPTAIKQAMQPGRAGHRHHDLLPRHPHHLRRARRRCTARPAAWACSSCASRPARSPRSSATGGPRRCAATTSCSDRARRGAHRPGGAERRHAAPPARHRASSTRCSRPAWGSTASSSSGTRSWRRWRPRWRGCSSPAPCRAPRTSSTRVAQASAAAAKASVFLAYDEVTLDPAVADGGRGAVPRPAASASTSASSRRRQLVETADGGYAARDQRLAVQGLRHLRELVPLGRHHLPSTSPTARSPP